MAEVITKDGEGLVPGPKRAGRKVGFRFANAFLSALVKGIGGVLIERVGYKDEFLAISS